MVALRHLVIIISALSSSPNETENETKQFANTCYHETASAILDTSNFEQQRDLSNLPAFVERITGKSKAALSRSAIAPGTPHTLVIAGAGLRAAELAR